jgi:hypothetical protein
MVRSSRPMVEALEGRKFLSVAAAADLLQPPLPAAAASWSPSGATPTAAHPTSASTHAHAVHRGAIPLVAHDHMGVAGRVATRHTLDHPGMSVKNVLGAIVAIPVLGIAHLFGKGI